MKKDKIYKIVLVRHGESVWNKTNIFTGWTDVKLTNNGLKQAQEAGDILKKEKYNFDIAFSNTHLRSKKTLQIILKKLNLEKIPTYIDWRLNERHYGNLQGLNKVDIKNKYGEKQYMLWRRSYDVRPPEITKTNPTYNRVMNNPDYKNIKIPKSECLKDVILRVVPFWKKEIIPLMKKDKKIIISASGNSLRALIKYLEKIPSSKISEFNIATGVPMVFEFNSNFKLIKRYYLGDKKKIKENLDKIKNLNNKK